jgi:hypothetical protein
MNEKFKKTYFQFLRVAISEAVRRDAFYVDCQPSTWIRRWGWKADMIEVSATSKVIVNLFVYAPTIGESGSQDGFEILSLRGLGLLRGSKQSAIPLPEPKDIGSEALRIATDLRGALSWFDNFDTPLHCLAYLRRTAADPTSATCRAGSPVYLGLERYLQSLPTELEERCCRLQPGMPATLEGFRRLFVVPPYG